MIPLCRRCAEGDHTDHKTWSRGPARGDAGCTGRYSKRVECRCAHRIPVRTVGLEGER